MTDFKAESHAHVTRIYHFYKCRTYVYLVCRLFFITINKFITSFPVISDFLLLVHVWKKFLFSPNQPDAGFPCLYCFSSVFCSVLFFLFIYRGCHAVFLITYWNTICCIKSSWWKAALRIAEDRLLPSSLPQKEDKLLLLQKARI